MANKSKFVVAGLLVVVAVVYLMVSSTGATAHYFLTIEELKAMGPKAMGRNITVSGAVLGDTINYDVSRPQVTFTIVQIPGDPKAVERAGGLSAVLAAAVSNPQADRLEIVLNDVKPDLLQPQAQAIVRGRLGEDGRFHADEVLLKCPSRYEEDVPAQVKGS